MKDAQGDLAPGRTRWRRFAAVVLPAAAAAGAIVFGMSNGAIAASFAVSGQTFKVSADRLVGTGFVQYGGAVHPKDEATGKAKDVPVATSGIADARLYNLCQSVKVPGMPVSLVINAGGDPDAPAHATNLLIDMADLQGDATFTNIHIGQDAGTLDAAGPDVKGQSGSFAQQASDVEIKNLKQVAWSTSAGTFALNGLHLYVDVNPQGPKECFPDPKK
ncbi:DUF6230 family protein [Planosporangium mesophilum]|uniref:Cholesterol esterase n=1 Tax=Planosporangium mesophilum TaxID=689768 RepID=A0A8J3THR7_9ACTN|nr:DUF6230 family protein [Planosporangium mesophilum]NJC82560.1 cholesterol esterase [Planosporangium mesophilum]GII26484.1 cholesterol esterase [Planosporangium mesophilum]